MTTDNISKASKAADKDPKKGADAGDGKGGDKEVKKKKNPYK